MDFQGAVQAISSDEKDPRLGETFVALAKKNWEAGVPFYLISFAPIGDSEWNKYDGINFHASQLNLPDTVHLIVDLLNFRDGFQKITVIKVSDLLLESAALTKAFKRPEEDGLFEQLQTLHSIVRKIRDLKESLEDMDQREELAGMETKLTNFIRKLPKIENIDEIYQKELKSLYNIYN